MKIFNSSFWYRDRDKINQALTERMFHRRSAVLPLSHEHKQQLFLYSTNILSIETKYWIFY
jgi:hypothetical protein